MGAPLMLTVTDETCVGVAGGGGDTGEFWVLLYGQSFSLVQEKTNKQMNRKRVEFFIP